jgi:Tfp pilus assembly protein PilZ
VVGSRKQAGEAQTERRSAQRVKLDLWMEEVQGDETYFLHTGNLSQEGVFFDQAIPHDVGASVNLKFKLPGDDEMIITTGKVVHAGQGSDQNIGMGVHFVELKGKNKKRIHKFFKQL